MRTLVYFSFTDKDRDINLADFLKPPQDSGKNVKRRFYTVKRTLFCLLPEERRSRNCESCWGCWGGGGHFSVSGSTELPLSTGILYFGSNNSLRGGIQTQIFLLLHSGSTYSLWGGDPAGLFFSPQFTKRDHVYSAGL